MGHKIKLMLDSSAFTTWKKATEIDLSAYIKFVQKHEHLLHSYVNLDVIPGTHGRVPTSHQVEEAAEQGYRNYQRMRLAWLRPMPVYHIGESRSWLDRYLDSGCERLGLGGLVGVNKHRRQKFLDGVFSYLCGLQGYPEVKVHGFGVTTPELIVRYPWSSVDSSSWVMGSKTGVCMIPHRFKDAYEYDFLRRPINVKFCETKNGKADLGIIGSVVHYRTLGRGARKYVDAYLGAEGLSSERASAEYGHRCRVNAHFYRKVSEHRVPKPFADGHMGFFGSNSAPRSGSPAPTKLRIFLVMPKHRDYCSAVLEEGMVHHLYSYLSLRGVKNLEHYVNTGYFAEKEVV